jgi:hypothetical protein
MTISKNVENNVRQAIKLSSVLTRLKSRVKSEVFQQRTDTTPNTNVLDPNSLNPDWDTSILMNPDSGSNPDPDPVLRIWIRDPVPFDPWIKDTEWGKNPDPESGMNTPDHISESLKTILFWLKIPNLNFFMRIRIRDIFDPRSGIEKIRIRDGKIRIRDGKFRIRDPL